MEKEESRIIDKSLIYARAQAQSSRKIELPYHSPNYTLIKRPQKGYFTHKMRIQWIIKRLIARLVHLVVPGNVSLKRKIP